MNPYLYDRMRNNKVLIVDVLQQINDRQNITDKLLKKCIRVSNSSKFGLLCVAFGLYCAYVTLDDKTDKLQKRIKELEEKENEV